jgi:hypothetical protein
VSTLALVNLAMRRYRLQLEIAFALGGTVDGFRGLVDELADLYAGLECECRRRAAS